MNYQTEVVKAMHAAPAAVGRTRAELEQRIDEISAVLKGPLDSAARLSLCEARAGYYKALDAMGPAA